MQPFRFSFNGEHELELPEGNADAWHCATDIIEGRCYPFPIDYQPRVVVDIGAHCGEFTIMAALLWPKSAIHAFEPFPATCDMLRRNMAKFPNVVVHQVGVAAKTGMASLNLSTIGSVAHSIRRCSHHSDESVQIQLVDPDFIAALQPDVLKIDAEGVEAEIISGLGQRATRIERIHFEFHSEADRLAICYQLDATHSMSHARIFLPEQGEMLYTRRR